MRILCLGDSNTYGYDPRGFFGDRYDAGNRWVDMLAKQTGHDCINAGVNGRQIPRATHELCLHPGQRDADILLVMLGTNDLLNGASSAETTARMEAFLTSVRTEFQRILLVAPPPMKRGAWVSGDELVTESHLLAEEYRLLAERLGMPFADPRDWEIGLAFDGVHFTEAVHHAFAENLRKELCL